jgi:hypothetical protein
MILQRGDGWGSGHFQKQEITKEAMPGPAYRAAVVADINELPVRTIKARRLGEQRWEIFIENPRKRIPASESKQLNKKAVTVLKDFGGAVGAPARKAAD